MIGSDIYIAVPASGSLKIHGTDPLAEECISQLTATSYYECDREIADSLARSVVGPVEVAYMDDEYDGRVQEWMSGFAYYTYQQVSNLGVLQIVLPGCDWEDTQIGDMVASGHVTLRAEGKEYSLGDYLISLGLTRCGRVRSIFCNDITVDKSSIPYLLAGESGNSEHFRYKIRENVFGRIEDLNFAQFDFYEVYASPRGMVYLPRDFSEDYRENIEDEVLALFICEIAILQNAAVSRINNRIKEELLANSNISSRETLQIQIEYGKTVLLWDNNIFHSYLAQKVSDRLVTAFETDRLMQEYEKNDEHIKEIAALKSGIAAQIEGRILNVVAVVLSVFQILQFCAEIENYIYDKSFQHGSMAISSLIVLGLIWLAVYESRRRK